MKITKFILAISSMAFLNACSTTQFYYSSKASIPHYSSSTETVMNVVLNDTNNQRLYGVLTAVDDEQLPYLLIAPKANVQSTRSNDLSDFNVTQATYIDLDAAREFENSLEKIVSEWDNLGDNDGYFYEFSSVPRIEVQQIEENTVQFAPSVRFFFNVTDEGSTGEMIIKHDNFQTGESVVRRFNMDDLEDIEDLESLIEKGIKHFE